MWHGPVVSRWCRGWGAEGGEGWSLIFGWCGPVGASRWGRGEFYNFRCCKLQISIFLLSFGGEFWLTYKYICKKVYSVQLPYIYDSICKALSKCSPPMQIESRANVRTAPNSDRQIKASVLITEHFLILMKSGLTVRWHWIKFFVDLSPCILCTPQRLKD